MRVVLTDITKMRGGCCVAGICHEDGLLYRLDRPVVKREDVVENGWRVGSLLVGNFCRKTPQDRVHVEDAMWQARNTQLVADIYLRNILVVSCVTSPCAALGIQGRGTPIDAIQPQGRSIVTIFPQSISISLTGYGKVRANILLGNSWMLDLPITDIRFFLANGEVDVETVSRVQTHINNVVSGREELFVRIGLARPFSVPPPRGDGVPRYWLQVDGLHFFSRSDGHYVRDFKGQCQVGDLFGALS